MSADARSAPVLGGVSDRTVEAPAPLGDVAAHDPELPERDRERNLVLVAAAFDRPVDRRAQVVELDVERVYADSASVAGEDALVRGLGVVEERAEMAISRVALGAGVAQALDRVGADRLQQREPAVGVPHEAPLDERQRVAAGDRAREARR